MSKDKSWIKSKNGLGVCNKGSGYLVLNWAPTQFYFINLAKITNDISIFILHFLKFIYFLQFMKTRLVALPKQNVIDPERKLKSTWCKMYVPRQWYSRDQLLLWHRETWYLWACHSTNLKSRFHTTNSWTLRIFQSILLKSLTLKRGTFKEENNCAGTKYTTLWLLQSKQKGSSHHFTILYHHLLSFLMFIKEFHLITMSLIYTIIITFQTNH